MLNYTLSYFLYKILDSYIYLFLFITKTTLISIYIIYLIFGIYYEEIILVYFGRLNQKKNYFNIIIYNV